MRAGDGSSSRIAGAHSASEGGSREQRPARRRAYGAGGARRARPHPSPPGTCLAADARSAVRGEEQRSHHATRRPSPALRRPGRASRRRGDRRQRAVVRLGSTRLTYKATAGTVANELLYVEV